MTTLKPMIKERVELPDTVEGIYAEYGERIVQVLSLFTDKTLSDTMPFGEVRKMAFKIIPQHILQAIEERLVNSPRK